jgi:hypothetical protein
VLIAVGDIFTPASNGVDWLSRRARGNPVIYVPVNHEWYSPNHLNNVDAETETARPDFPVFPPITMRVRFCR